MSLLALFCDVDAAGANAAEELSLLSGAVTCVQVPSDNP